MLADNCYTFWCAISFVRYKNRIASHSKPHTMCMCTQTLCILFVCLFNLLIMNPVREKKEKNIAWRSVIVQFSDLRTSCFWFLLLCWLAQLCASLRTQIRAVPLLPPPSTAHDLGSITYSRRCAFSHAHTCSTFSLFLFLSMYIYLCRYSIYF